MGMQYSSKFLEMSKKNIGYVLPVKTFLNQWTTSSQSKIFRNLQNKVNINEQTLHRYLEYELCNLNGLSNNQCKQKDKR